MHHKALLNQFIAFVISAKSVSLQHLDSSTWREETDKKNIAHHAIPKELIQWNKLLVQNAIQNLDLPNTGSLWREQISLSCALNAEKNEEKDFVHNFLLPEENQKKGKTKNLNQ